MLACDTRREVLLVDAESRRDLAQQLQRGHALASFEPREVGRRAAGERELALAEPGGDPRLLQAPARGDRVVDVRVVVRGRRHWSAPSAASRKIPWQRKEV